MQNELCALLCENFRSLAKFLGWCCLEVPLSEIVEMYEGATYLVGLTRIYRISRIEHWTLYSYCFILSVSLKENVVRKKMGSNVRLAVCTLRHWVATNIT